MLIREQGILRFSGEWSMPPCSLLRDGGRVLDLHFLFGLVLTNVVGKGVREIASADAYTFTADRDAKTILSNWLNTTAYLISTTSGEYATLTLPSMLLVNRDRRIDVEIGDVYFKLRRCA